MLTDDEGAYTKSGLEGKVTITPVKENWQFTPPTVEVQSTNPSLVFIGTALLYTVSGKTVDAQGNPVPGVQVSFTGEDGITETVISDENGEFTKSGLTGEVTVRAFKGNWSFEPAEHKATRGVSDLLFRGTDITYTIEGSVRAGDGTPIENVKVTVSTDGERLWSTDVLTGPDGSFRFEGLTGVVTVTASKANWKFSPKSKTVYEADTKIEFIGTELLYTVTGSILDDKGNTIPNAVITAKSDEEIAVGRGVSDSTGEFAISGLEGEVTITAHKDGYNFTPGEGFLVSGADRLLFTGYRILTPFTVSGAVTSAHNNEPLQGVVITLERDGEVIRSVSTDENGRFELENVTGRVTVRARLDDQWTFSPTAVVVEENNDAVNFVGSKREESHRVSGQIVYDDLTPVPAASVFATLASGATMHTFTDAEGKWELDGLVGYATIRPEKPGHTFTPDSQGVSAPRDGVNFRATPPVPDLYSISGEVIDYDGEPVDGAFVVLKRASSDIVKTQRIVELGFFQVDGLTGEYYVSIQKSGWVFEPAAILVTGEEHDLVFYGSELSQLYDASGVVVDNAGVPVPGVLIEATLVQDSQIRKYAVTDVNGRWVLPNLAGQYQIAPQRDVYSFMPTSKLVEGDEAVAFLAIPDSFAVTGRVEDEDGNPMPMVNVRVWNGEEQLASAASDSTGMFFIPGLSGELDITVDKAGYEFAPGSHRVAGPTTVTFTGRPLAATYPLNLSVRSTVDNTGLTGVTVKTSGNVGLKGIQVLIRFLNTGVVTSTTTDDQGPWLATGLAGSVRIEPVHSTFQFTPSFQDISRQTIGVDFTAFNPTP